MNIADIQKHVTHFSEQIFLNTHHKQEIVIGGKITAIIPSFHDEYPMSIIVLDDYVGVMRVFAPTDLLKLYEEEFQVGSFIFLEAMVNILHRSPDMKKKDVTLFALDVKNISEMGEAVS